MPTSSTYFLPLILPIQKKKKKTLLLPINSHLLFHFLQLFPSFFISPLLFTLLLHFIIFSFLYFASSSPSLILYKIRYHLFYSIHISHKKTMSSHSLMIFYLNMCFDIVIFFFLKFLLQSLLSLL